MLFRNYMFSSFFSFQALMFAWIFLSTTTASPSFAEVMTARADAWCPYNCVPNSDKPGILIELLQESFKSEGTTIDYGLLSWTQAVNSVREGKFNAIIAAAAEDAVGMVHTEQPQVTQTSCVYGLLSSTKKVSKATDLKSFKSLGIVKDYSYGDMTNKILKSPAMKKILSPIGGEQAVETNLRRVVDKKIEAFMEDSKVVEFYLKSNNITNVKELGCTEDRMPLWIAFTATNPKSKGWVSTLAAGHAALEKSGRLSEIMARYGITNK